MIIAELRVLCPLCILNGLDADEIPALARDYFNAITFVILVTQVQWTPSVSKCMMMSTVVHGALETTFSGEDEIVQMTTDALKTAEINEADEAFARLVTSQVSRVTQELVKLEQLLKAGMVEPSVLREFRKVVDEVRKTSWNVQQSLGGNAPSA